MPDLSQERLYYLYEHANAYISFSREESFGWALADAILFNKPIISRNIGVISSLAPNQKGLYIYSDSNELIEIVKHESFEKGDYDREIFSPEIFENKLLSIVDSIKLTGKQ
jgi:hypothetical protein